MVGTRLGDIMRIIFVPPANEVEVVGGKSVHNGQNLLLGHKFYITPGRLQYKTLILSTKVDKNR